MRRAGALVVGVSCVLLAGSAASALAAPAVEACATRSDVLGLSRIVEVDADSGPTFGQTPVGGYDILQKGEVILTFDDGPSRTHTPAVLKALKAHCTKATFFIVGRMAAADPATLRAVADDGHTIGIHTWSHARLQGLAADKAKDEIELGLSAVAGALKKPVAPFFRFPYLRTSEASRAYLKQRHIAAFGIDVDSRDFKTRDGSVVKANVLKQLAKRGKGIILFHDIQTSTARSIGDILDALKANGYKVVHIVPKAPATTLADYDTLAAREIDKRNRVATNDPMETRSVVWPQAGNGDSPKEVLPWSRPAAAKPAAAATSSSTKSGTVPWLAEWLQP